MKIALTTAGGSGIYPQTSTGSFAPVPPARPFAPVLRPVAPTVDPQRLPAEVVSRQRRAPPPADADYDLLVYLLLAVAFLLVVWRPWEDTTALPAAASAIVDLAD